MPADPTETFGLVRLPKSDVDGLRGWVQVPAIAAMYAAAVPMEQAVERIAEHIAEFKEIPSDVFANRLARGVLHALFPVPTP